MAAKRGLLYTYGTRGDVEPFVALAGGLRAAGVEVRLATSGRFRDWVESFGVSCFPVSDASLASIESQDGKTMLEGGSGLFRRITAGIRLARKSGRINEELMRDTWGAAEIFAPDFIVFHPKLFAAPHVAERLGVPAFLAVLQPMIVPTRAFPAMGMPALRLPIYNRMTYALVAISYGAFRKAVNRFRKETLGLPPIVKRRDVLFPPGAGTIPVLHAISPAVIPRPPDWPDNALITGYWRLDKCSEYTPPAELAAFVEGGPPPVFVGFGSMTSIDPKALGQLITGALRKAGQRGVIAKGWAELNIEDSDDMIAIGAIPYDWLFPRMAAVVHHGGAGTTAEGFRAGVPCVVCPFFGDQSGWAEISRKLGVGAQPVPRKRLTQDRLAASIREAVSNAGHRENAEQLAEQLRNEDGVRNAVKIILSAMHA